MPRPHYIEPVFRPPAEADSLIFQVAYGCPHNTCRFCGMYKGVRYRERPEAEVLAEFSAVAPSFREESRIFLADGDVMALPFARLRACLERLNAVYPALARVNVYANGSSILSKTRDELLELRRLKLNTLYLGMESGSEALLKLICKPESAAVMTEAVQLAQSCGFKCSVMILLGLGGRKHSAGHIRGTIEVLNRMRPRLLSALRFIPVPNIRMFDGFDELTEYEAVQELRAVIAGLELDRTVFRANHTSNPVPLAGRFPADKQALLMNLDMLLNANMLDRHSPGPRPFSL
jgi:radical SAM superfamily enzyme YgiQ (UPF0313 family)